MMRLVALGIALPILLIANGCSGAGGDPAPEAKESTKKETEKTYVTNSIAIKLVLIPKGKFLMGSPKGGGAEQDRETQHEVEISQPFYLGVHEVTQQQFEQVMGTNPSYFGPNGKAKNMVVGIDTNTLPVESVTWEEADQFCKKLTALDAEKAAGRVYQLPTEAEWEYACRAGANPWQPFNTGAVISIDLANYGSNVRRTRAVGSYKANAFGLYDMHGNVLEWCADWMGAYKSEPVTDPVGPDSGRFRVYRGGGWVSKLENCRSAMRLSATTGYRMVDVGFRVKLLAR